MRFRVLTQGLAPSEAIAGNCFPKILDGIRSKLLRRTSRPVCSAAKRAFTRIYHKMLDKHLGFSQVLDIYGFRGDRQDVPSCYRAGRAALALQAGARQVQGLHRDPEGNGYQSCTTTLIGLTARRSRSRSAKACTTWPRKASRRTGWGQRRERRRSAGEDAQMAAVAPRTAERDGDSSEFLEHVKVDLFPTRSTFHTQRGRFLRCRGRRLLISPTRVHTDIGHRCVAARIDHELIPLSAELANGNQVEIITATPTEPGVAELRQDRAGAQQDPPVPQARMQQDGVSSLGENMLIQELAGARRRAVRNSRRRSGSASFRRAGKIQARDLRRSARAVPRPQVSPTSGGTRRSPANRGDGVSSR